MLARTSMRSRAAPKRSGWIPIGNAATRVSQPLSSTPSGVPYRHTIPPQFRPLSHVLPTRFPLFVKSGVLILLVELDPMKNTYLQHMQRHEALGILYEVHIAMSRPKTVCCTIGRLTGRDLSSSHERVEKNHAPPALGCECMLTQSGAHSHRCGSRSDRPSEPRAAPPRARAACGKSRKRGRECAGTSRPAISANSDPSFAMSEVYM